MSTLALPPALNNLDVPPEQLRAFLAILQHLGIGPDPRDNVPLADVITRYLADARRDICAEAHTVASYYLSLLAADLGQLTMRELTPLHLKDWIHAHPTWKSAHTRHAVNTRVQRCLNWAVGMKLVRENPFKGVSMPKGEPQAEMTDEEYRALLRASTPRFRRVLVFLRFTGCRPGELCKVRWTLIDWPARLVRLHEHKTKKKTGKPRLFALHPVMMKLLAWMKRNPDVPLDEDTAVNTIKGILADGPIPAKAFHRRARQAGIPTSKVYALARAAGAESQRVGGIGAKGQDVWKLRDDTAAGEMFRRRNRSGYFAHVWQDGERVQVALGEDLAAARQKLEELKAAATSEAPPASPATNAPTPDAEHVFLDINGQPWTRKALDARLQRAREKADLDATKLYGLRHKFGSDAIRKGVNLKVLAELMGHTTTKMTEHYVHIAGEGETMQAAVEAMFDKIN